VGSTDSLSQARVEASNASHTTSRAIFGRLPPVQPITAVCASLPREPAEGGLVFDVPVSA
jgi:hypothetical protein